ncbi:ATP-dependent DNA helicase PIF1-like [Senna tora]|uniref:ATP-dependent DNA helicase n=1 Tax=Senna tora TaxID=362788 RepID=A0A834SXF6_9FABA|nr:ATP-dependent DNA helicase PIF1-like [Senna tora]
MAHRHWFEAQDHTLRDIMHSQSAELANQPFDGKVVVFGGDSCQILLLFQGLPVSVEENNRIATFAEWILKIGDETIRKVINDEEHEIDIDDDILIHSVDEPVQSIVHKIYPNLGKLPQPCIFP